MITSRRGAALLLLLPLLASPAPATAATTEIRATEEVPSTARAITEPRAGSDLEDLGATAATKTSASAEATAPIRFGPCPPDVGAGVQCGRLEVPRDHANPVGPRISLALSRIPASGTPQEHRGALLVNPGGPGDPGLDYAASKRAKLPEGVRRAYDVVGFDPRGVGRSAPVDCGPTGGLFERPRPDPVPRDHAAELSYLDGLGGIAEDCRRNSGALLPHLSTVETARDMDLVRQALGEPVLNYLGVSYGTYLGAAYAAEFPHRTGRMVLDSAVGPDDWHRFDVRQGFAMLAQRDVLFDWIAAHPELGLGTDRAAVRSSYLAARARLPIGELGPDEFDRAAYEALSRTERWEPFARGLAEVLRTGDGSALLPDAGDRNSEAALRAVKCADSPRPSRAEVLGSVRALRAADPQPVLTGLEAAVCAFWSPPRETARLGHPAMPPVLITQAAHDPTTPLDGTVRLRARMPGARMAVLDDGYSHGAFASQRNACLDGTAERYLLTGQLPAADVHCAGPGLPATSAAARP